MKLENVYELWDRFDKSPVVEMSLTLAGDSLSLKKAHSSDLSGGQAGYAGSKGDSDSQAIVKGSDYSKNAGSMEEAGKPEMAETAENTDGLIEIKAPLVGTFYRKSSPDAEPFVKEGQSVKKGDVIGIIEAMKLMNEVTAQSDGLVKKIVAEDGTMVQFDELLMLLER